MEAQCSTCTCRYPQRDGARLRIKPPAKTFPDYSLLVGWNLHRDSQLWPPVSPDLKPQHFNLLGQINGNRKMPSCAALLMLQPVCRTTLGLSEVSRCVLTPWCKVLLEKLTGLQLVKKLPAFHGSRWFITALTSVRHLSLSWASPIQSIYTQPTSWRLILILSTHLSR